MWLRRQREQHTIMCGLQRRVVLRAVRTVKRSAGRKSCAATDSRRAPMKWIVYTGSSMGFSLLTQMSSEVRGKRSMVTLSAPAGEGGLQ